MAGSKLHFRSTRINCIILGYWTFTKSWSLDTSDFWHVWIYSCLLKTSVGLTFELTPIPVNGKPFTARWNFQLLPILNISACTCYYDVLWAECFFLNFFFNFMLKNWDININDFDFVEKDKSMMIQTMLLNWPCIVYLNILQSIRDLNR